MRKRYTAQHAAIPIKPIAKSAKIIRLELVFFSAKISNFFVISER